MHSSSDLGNVLERKHLLQDPREPGRGSLGTRVPCKERRGACPLETLLLFARPFTASDGVNAVTKACALYRYPSYISPPEGMAIAALVPDAALAETEQLETF